MNENEYLELRNHSEKEKLPVVLLNLSTSTAATYRFEKSSRYNADFFVCLPFYKPVSLTLTKIYGHNKFKQE